MVVGSLTMTMVRYYGKLDKVSNFFFFVQI